MGSIFGEVDFYIILIMEHIDACVAAFAEITGIDDLSCTDFLDVTDRVALAEDIGEGLNGEGWSCGLERSLGVVLGELIRMSAASS
jgi:hypothetical protein